MAWNEQSGGFDTSPNVGSSQSVTKDKGSQEKNGIIPVCIRSIHRSFVDDQFTAVDGSQLHQIVLIAKVMSAEVNNQRYDYKLSDYTGSTLLAREYINDEEAVPPELMTEGSYVRVYGTLKSFQRSPHLSISSISKVKDPNIITSHLLEMTYSFLKMNKAAAGDGVTVDKSADTCEQVRTVIQANKTITGLSTNEIAAALPHVTSDEVTKAINWLSGEGFIFSTIDDEHFRATEDA